MTGDLRLVLRITGDASNLKAEVVGAKREVEGLGQSAAGAGRTGAGGLDAMAGAAARLAAPLATLATAGATIMAVARAGDQATASFGRLALAAGSAEAAVDVHERLYRLSLQTGVSVRESADAFGRFAIAAREAGATQAQVLSIVQLMQQAGAVAGASVAETASATMQLAQALASGRLQGDELRSILEAMPNLAEALANELGVGVGELRKLGEEGRLTSGVVIPALERAAGAVAAQFRELPPTMERGMSTLRAATNQLLADFDKALGLSNAIARALLTAAEAANRVRLANGLGAPAEQAAYDGERASARAAELRRLIAADEAQLAPREIDGVRVAVPSGTRSVVERRLQDRRQALAAIEAEEEAANARLDNAERDRLSRGLADRDAAAARERESNRRTAEAALNELRDRLSKERVIRREAAEAEAQVRNALALGATTEADAERDLQAIAARMREELAKLQQARPAAPRATVERPQQTEAFDPLRARSDDLRRQMRTAREIREEAEQEARKLHALFGETNGARGISEDTMNRVIARARENYDRARPLTELEEQAQRSKRALDELGKIGENAFDRVGSAVTAAMASGELDLRRFGQVGQAVVSELTQAFMKLALINPIKNALGIGGGGSTLFDLIGGLGGAGGSGGGGGSGGFFGTIASAASSLLGFVLHEGGVVGRGAVPMRRVPEALFASAPRYHSGSFIGPDETPAILRRGEGVFTPEQMAALGPAGTTNVFAPTVNFSGNAGSQADRDELVNRIRQMWLQDINAAAPAIVQASRASLGHDARRKGLQVAVLGG